MLSFVINNVRSRTITSTTSTCISKFNATSSSLLLKQQQQQQRSYWREVLRVKSYNPKAETNKIIYEDPSTMAERSSRAQAGEGLLQRKNRFRNYIKPWMKRKRLKEVKKYRSMERGVLNLKKYVHFVNDYTKKHLWKGDK